MSLDAEKLKQKINGSERPDLAIAVELAALFHSEMEALKDTLSVQIGQAVNLNATTAKRLTELDGKLHQFMQDSEKNRHDRAEKELKEAEARYLLAQHQKDTLSTDEKIQAGKIVEDKLSALERARADQRRTWWQERVLPGVITALIISIVAPVGLGFFIAVLVFVLRALGVEVQFP